MHKCTSLAIHDDTGIAKLLFILTSNGATDRDSGYSCIIYFTVFYLYICGVILPTFMLLCMYYAFIRILYFVRKWRNKTDQSIQLSPPVTCSSVVAGGRELWSEKLVWHKLLRRNTEYYMYKLSCHVCFVIRWQPCSKYVNIHDCRPNHRVPSRNGRATARYHSQVWSAPAGVMTLWTRPFRFLCIYH